jgi:hypothetical protein
MKKNLIKKKIRILRSWTSPKEGGHNISKPCNTSKTSSTCKTKVNEPFKIEHAFPKLVANGEKKTIRKWKKREESWIGKGVEKYGQLI